MIDPRDLHGGIKAALKAAGVERVSLIEVDFEHPRLELLVNANSEVHIEVGFDEGEPSILRLDAMLLSGLSEGESGGGGDLELTLRVLNEMNRLEATPWKLWLKGMKVEFNGVLVDDPIGEVWATWSIPAELVEVDDLPRLCRSFAERLEQQEIPGLRQALG